MISLQPAKSEENAFQENDLVCYCFEYSKKDIEQDFRMHGYSRILDKIKLEKKNNGCHCEVKNPKGR